MVKRFATEASRDVNPKYNWVLLVSREGSICSILEAPESALATKSAVVTGGSIEDLWPRQLANSIRSNIKRTLRGRHAHCDDAENPVDGRHCEFIYVPQRRDRVLLIVRDISQAKLTLSEYSRLAYTDEVTALPNREFLVNELQKITDFQRLKEGRAAVICIHVDQFDDHAHALIAGREDDFLRNLAQRLTVQIRGINQADATNDEAYSLVARTDFREFTVVLPSIERGEHAESVAMRLLDALRQPVPLGERRVIPAVHGGVALFPQDGTNAATLYENANAAMQDARNSMSSVFRYHSGTLRLRNLQRQDIASDIKAALDREDFSLKYLPIVDANTSEVHSVEALLRWPETILGKRSTQKIITIAEHTGLIVEIGAWVLGNACERLRSWRSDFQHDLRMAVNISAQEFSRADFVTRVETILKNNNISPDCLVFEINERVLFRNALQKHSTCEELRSLGIGIVIDDYGTGGSTLAHLSQSAAQGIKIDNSFVANIETNERDRAACAAAIALAHGLGMQVIAEGVETEFQAQYLRDNGCDLLQGFLFSQPMAGADVITYVNSVAITDRAKAYGS